MKKFICALLCILFLSGCYGKSVTPVNKNLTYRAHIFYYDEEYECFVNVGEDGKMTFCIDGGTLDGFTTVFDKDKITCSYLGKETTLSKNSYKGALTSIFEMNESLTDKKAINKSGKCIIEGRTNSGEYTLFLSGTGLPLCAELDGRDFYVDFYDVSIVN